MLIPIILFIMGKCYSVQILLICIISFCTIFLQFFYELSEKLINFKNVIMKKNAEKHYFSTESPEINIKKLKNYIRKVEYSHETKKTRSRKKNEAHVKQKKKSDQPAIFFFCYI